MFDSSSFYKRISENKVALESLDWLILTYYFSEIINFIVTIDGR